MSLSLVDEGVLNATVNATVDYAVTAFNCSVCEGESELVIVLAVLGMLFLFYAVPAIGVKLITFVFYFFAYVFAFFVFLYEKVSGKRGVF